MSLRDWINAYDLGCPHLRYNTEKAAWVTLEKDPCLTCDVICPQQGKPFSKPSRLIIVPSKVPKINTEPSDKNRTLGKYDEGN